MWIKPDDNTEDSFQVLFSSNETGVSFAESLQIGFDPSNNQIDLWSNGCTGADDFEAYVGTQGFNISGTVTDWHHVAYVESSSGHTLYIDGVPVTGSYGVGSSSGTCFFDEIATGTTHIAIGQAKTSAGTGYEEQVYQGLIDDFRLYNYTLSATQIKKLYNENSVGRFGPSSGSP